MITKLLIIILKNLGWTIKGELTQPDTKCIIVAAPHTSNWDYIIGRLACYDLGLPLHYLIKKEACFFPLNFIIKGTGGIPIDRSKRTGLIPKLVALFNEHDHLHLMITPEGTRSWSNKWKTGFYHIALGAKVPLYLGYLDYKKKEAGIGKIIHPSGDIQHDMQVIEAFYRDKTALYPDQYNSSIYQSEDASNPP